MAKHAPLKTHHTKSETPINNPCARTGCKNTGTNVLRVLFIEKEGWFCNSCKKDLEEKELVYPKDTKVVLK